MKTGNCRCGNRIFFNNHHCLSCHATLGRCCECGSLTSIQLIDERQKCDACETFVHRCSNQDHHVCNAYHSKPESLCGYCEFTNVIPSLHESPNQAQWAAMESAKRRLLMQLEDLQLPPFLEDLQATHPLQFAFLKDAADADGNVITVTTGHQDGLITINLSEADSVHRERLRVELGEPHRTLVGHMRHEYGHYLDWAWASRVAASDYHSLFGNPDAVDYAKAMKRHYEHGAPQNWTERHVSAYATMHPWEDFAETVNLYLDMMAIAFTAVELSDRALDVSPDANSRYS